ncbi:hypothetical protein ACFRR7_36645 [Streptomyces sp. NPDC056909]|uniref:hypothetical protein n=1 Tax=Streptomyces sp. NPDC056909 TaxID=3345963 RepID=UPI0036815EE2
MRIDIPSEVFSTEEALPDILYLLNTVVQGRHEWATNPQVVETAGYYLRKHAPKNAQAYVELARKSMVAAMWSGSSDAPTTVRVEAENLRDYVADLVRPALVVVEDRDSDGHFIRALACVFASQRLLKALENGWIELEHGGGGSLARIAGSTAEKFKVCIRAVAILDSDRMTPNQATQSHRKAEQIQKLGISVHVLELREAENYAPNRTLAETGRKRDASRRLAHLKKLTPEQRGHYDMKYGFGPVDKEPKIPAEQSSLYDGVDRLTLMGLRGGFGKNVLKVLEDTSHNLTSRDFEALGVNILSELRSLMTKISNVI